MKANEFVKKYGWEFSIDAHKKNSWLESKYFDTRKIESWDGNDSIVRNGIDVLRKPFMKSLGELVNAYELVESYGGLASARKEAHKDCFEFNSPLLSACYLVASVDA